MNVDSLACNKNDTIFIVWKRNLEAHAPERLASKLATLHCNRTAVEAKSFAHGSYNECYKVHFDDHGPDVIVRFAILGRSFLRKEKVSDEVAVMKYLAAEHPSVPVPKVFGSGSCAVGPYLVTEFIEGELMVEYLKEAITDHRRPTILNLNMEMSILKRAYREMAWITLALFSCKFSHIGAVGNDGSEATWSVTKRALTFNMNELIGLANFPSQDFHKCQFSMASEYFVALAEHHLHHLKTQRNDTVIDEADCRTRYIARCLFRKIAREFCSSYNQGPFPLFCDDLRPSNVIVDEDLHIQAIIDWEYCYAAPVEFAHCSPWWLLLARPDDWESGLDDFVAQFLPRHEIFLEILRECEQGMMDRQELLPSQEKRLSEHMRDSVETGLFWFCLAARSSFGFDEIYWRFVDEKYFGKFNNLEERLKLLTDEEQASVEPFVQLKLEQAKEKILDEHQTVDEIVDS